MNKLDQNKMIDLKRYSFSSTCQVNSLKQTKFDMYAGDVSKKEHLQGKIEWLI